MGRMYKVTVRGTGQLNGPLKVDKTVIIEEQMAAKFNGGSRYEVIEAFVKTNYPGIRIDSIKSFAANVVLMPEDTVEKKSKSKNYTTEDNESRHETSANYSIKGAIVGSIINGFSPNEEDKEKERAEELKEERAEKKALRNLGKSVKEKINTVESIKTPNNKEGLVEILDDLTFKLKSQKWKPIIGANNDDEAKLINLLLGAYLLKFAQCLSKLELIDGKNNSLLYYKKELKNFKIRRLLGNYSYIFLLCGIAGIVAIFYQFGLFGK
jgi:hypothetical protein